MEFVLVAFYEVSHPVTWANPEMTIGRKVSDPDLCPTGAQDVIARYGGQ
jgi:hypothetical protein